MIRTKNESISEFVQLINTRRQWHFTNNPRTNNKNRYEWHEHKETYYNFFFIRPRFNGDIPKQLPTFISRIPFRYLSAYINPPTRSWNEEKKPGDDAERVSQDKGELERNILPLMWSIRNE